MRVERPAVSAVVELRKRTPPAAAVISTRPPAFERSRKLTVPAAATFGVRAVNFWRGSTV